MPGEIPELSDPDTPIRDEEIDLLFEELLEEDELWEALPGTDLCELPSFNKGH